MKFDEDAMRARAKELNTLISAVEEKTAALRAKRDDLEGQIAPIREEQDRLAKEFMRIERENDLFDLKQELALISRALKGKVLGGAA